MKDDRPNPDIFWTDEEVAELKAKGAIINESPPNIKTGVCCDCGKTIGEDEVICMDCIQF